jgi:hypothetical protein
MQRIGLLGPSHTLLGPRLGRIELFNARRNEFVHLAFGDIAGRFLGRLIAVKLIAIGASKAAWKRWRDVLDTFQKQSVA